MDKNSPNKIEGMKLRNSKTLGRKADGSNNGTPTAKRSSRRNSSAENQFFDTQAPPTASDFDLIMEAIKSFGEKDIVTSEEICNFILNNNCPDKLLSRDVIKTTLLTMKQSMNKVGPEEPEWLRFIDSISSKPQHKEEQLNVGSKSQHKEEQVNVGPKPQDKDQQSAETEMIAEIGAQGLDECNVIVAPDQEPVVLNPYPLAPLQNDNAQLAPDQEPVPNPYPLAPLQNDNAQAPDQVPVLNPYPLAPLQNDNAQAPVQEPVPNPNPLAPFQNNNVQAPVQVPVLNPYPLVPHQNDNAQAPVQVLVLNPYPLVPHQNDNAQAPAQLPVLNPYPLAPLQNANVQGLPPFSVAFPAYAANGAYDDWAKRAKPQ